MEPRPDITFQETKEGYTFVNFNFHYEDID